MTKLTLETDNDWTKKKVKAAIHTEIDLLRKAVQRTQTKTQNFENKFGELDRKALYGRVDDMELVEWEGELETLKKLQEKLNSLVLKNTNMPITIARDQVTFSDMTTLLTRSSLKS